MTLLDPKVQRAVAATLEEARDHLYSAADLLPRDDPEYGRLYELAGFTADALARVMKWKCRQC